MPWHPKSLAKKIERRPPAAEVFRLPIRILGRPIKGSLDRTPAGKPRNHGVDLRRGLCRRFSKILLAFESGVQRGKDIWSIEGGSEMALLDFEGQTGRGLLIAGRRSRQMLPLNLSRDFC